METYPVWIRLHPDAEDDTMAVSVQARIHDPLWLLGRQWQFGELRHDGGATPIDVRVEGTSSPLSRLRSGAAESDAESIAVDPTHTPLEAVVEAEHVPEDRLENLRLRAEAGMHFVRMLRAAGLSSRAAAWIERSPLPAPSEETPDANTREWLAMAAGRIPDGSGLVTAIRSTLDGGDATAIDPAEAPVLRAWLEWAAGRLEGPPGGSPAWDPEHMEYAFTAAGMGPAGEVVLAAPEYVEGRLDWYDFDAAEGSLGATTPATPRRAFRIPAPLDFAGMPNPRFWTFEEPGIRFEALDMLSNPERAPSPATLLVLDFALSYSDDWFLIPLVLDAWTLFEATTVAVTDAFGDTSLAAPPEGRWNMFRLDSGSSGLSRVFVAPSPAEALEGPALEEVHFLADETANVAWGVERILPHPLGHGIELPARASTPRPPGPAGLTWTLTPPSPPGNWFPLLPVRIGRLALGALWDALDNEPAGRILADLNGPRLLHQEEVPPEGVQVTRRWQSARAIDGSLHFWTGRSKTPRRTEIAPAIRFDVVEWK